MLKENQKQYQFDGCLYSTMHVIMIEAGEKFREGGCFNSMRNQKC